MCRQTLIHVSLSVQYVSCESCVLINQKHSSATSSCMLISQLVLATLCKVCSIFCVQVLQSYHQNENAPALTHLPHICHSRFCHTDVIWRHDVILWRQLASWHHSVTSHDVMTSHHRPGYFVTPWAKIWSGTVTSRDVTCHHDVMLWRHMTLHAIMTSYRDVTWRHDTILKAIVMYHVTQSRKGQ